MRFRRKYVTQIGYFAQVKTSFFSPWQTIGKHPHGFGLYPEEHLGYPLITDHHAIEMIVNYKNWCCFRDKQATYSDYKIN